MKFYHKIRFKITFGITLIVLILFVGLGYSILIDQRQHILDSLHNNGKQIMMVIVKNSVDAIQFYNYLYLEELCITVEQTHGVAFCEIYDTQGNSLVQKSTVDATTLKQERKIGANILILEQPILDRETNHLGKVELGLYLDDLKQELKSTTIKLSSIFACVILLVALSLNYFLSKFFITPVLNLSHVASLLARKKFVNVNVKPRQDEIGELVKNFDVMSENLKKSFARIEKQNQELKESENKFSEVFRLSPNAYSITRISDGTMIEINNGYTKIFGYTEKDVKGKTSIELNTWVTESERKRVAGKLVADGKLDNEETQHRTKDNRIIDVQISSIIIEIGNEQVILAEVMDVTQRKSAEEALRKSEERLLQAQKMESIGTLAGGIAHDFNNILFPILGHSEMLMEDIPGDSPFRVDINQIYKGALRASELVKQILTFSRQESVELKLMEIEPIINEALKLIRSTIPTTIDIKQDIQTDCGIVKADPTQIHQIIMNLSTNAYHAMEETGGVLKVSLKEIILSEDDLISPGMTPGVYACLIIADTGKGMDKILAGKIFDPFFTTKEQGKGTGMGLSVVHGIVKNIDGVIQVHSDPGKGTEFKVYFPIEKGSLKKQSIPSIETMQTGTEQVLLVDDEEAILRMVKKMLERLGYQVTTQVNSIEALDVFRAAPDKFDIVITDMAMPNMSGTQLASAMTKIHPGIPVLLCTGFSETMSEEKAAFLGIQGFLLKPIVLNDLSQKIREVLEK